MDISKLTPQELQQIAAQIAALPTSEGGRSPLRPRQLHDLRLLPTATDPRPMFVWSADGPRDAMPHPFQEYPKLLWHQTTGEEITVYNAEQAIAHGSIYVNQPPASVAVLSQTELVRQALEGLTEQEREMVMQAQRADRLAKVQGMLAALSDADLDAVTGELPKRGAGRTRKDSAA